MFFATNREQSQSLILQDTLDTVNKFGVNNIPPEYKVRQCGNTWRYCNGICKECAMAKISYSTKTECTKPGLVTNHT